MNPPAVREGDRVVWQGRHGTVMKIDTSAQDTPVGRANGWPFAAWVLFDDRAAKLGAHWTSQSCVNAYELKVIP